jgi:hypothetical protein
MVAILFLIGEPAVDDFACLHVHQLSDTQNAGAVRTYLNLGEVIDAASQCKRDLG